MVFGGSPEALQSRINDADCPRYYFDEYSGWSAHTTEAASTPPWNCPSVDSVIVVTARGLTSAGLKTVIFTTSRPAQR